VINKGSLHFVLICQHLIQGWATNTATTTTTTTILPPVQQSSAVMNELYTGQSFQVFVSELCSF